MKALLIEFDAATGKRAGNINPNDPKLQCYGWQKLDTSPCLEIRVIEDDRDVTLYESIPGITVLNDDTEIEKAIDQICPPKYIVENDVLLKTHLEQKAINLNDIHGKDTNEQLKNLFNQGVKGIREVKRPSLAETYTK